MEEVAILNPDAPRARAALVADGVVQSVITIDPADTEFIAAVGAVPCGDEVQAGDLFDGAAFSKPEESK